MFVFMLTSCWSCYYDSCLLSWNEVLWCLLLCSFGSILIWLFRVFWDSMWILAFLFCTPMKNFTGFYSLEMNVSLKTGCLTSFILAGGWITERWLDLEGFAPSCRWPHWWIHNLMESLKSYGNFLRLTYFEEVGDWGHFFGCHFLSQAPQCLTFCFPENMRWAFLLHQPFCPDALPHHRYRNNGVCQP
jgi:hypothetical protein